MKKLATLLSTALLAFPIVASAEVTTDLTSLYTQLISLLKQEILLLQQQKHPSLTILQPSSAAPSTVVFTVNDRTGTEAIDFGDGHSTGSNGCPKNVFGFCDLFNSLSHVYYIPGAYRVTLYNRVGDVQRTVSSTTVQVTARAH